ncbi:hypothetical protein [Evansella cellulosilytica]|uniref:Uncharacterized protein n=1 Tax=Evansella cellulosilytica (strain ATCC 21833 / DSM 2522 / FERM P-1141 / JCM 9156 / N-4) TaxID=649639 RepID=E6TQY9_EVAC2|nr:hypothetical protein [Evansella cellulosilytica]ADU29365.1 hypothetical protein Bcell_1095 [Evansella cellulosilytica DSM 2522]
MDPILWIPIGFITIGFIILIFAKKSMESKLAFIKANKESDESAKKAKFIVWWIYGTTAWGVVSIILIVWFFNTFV